eukprot:TRINITY_DN3350_c0_g1_i1.p1 TRINITY_DN3350_c0_g1~~TRINITY_DN3350_c0_g1_i1.p1  ORF type:complete len:521 (+),score=80.40 TRINITY_DN3350_c0_g1_i1:240-1802(+)
MFEECADERTLGLKHGYTPIRSLGRGSFGTATLVRSKEGGLFVLKALDIGNIGRKRQDDTVKEASVLSSLKHRYIVRYHDGFLEAGSLAIITDFAEGGDLHQRIELQRRQSQAFSEPLILRWLAQAALGLKYVHERRIIHRDLKSQNLFLSGTDQLLIGDFGVCKELPPDSDSCIEERSIGTPLYFSPEVVNRNVYSFASDMWALGCVLHELAALRLPFEATSLPALATKIMRGTMLQLPAPFSSGLRQLCADLLAHDPERRLRCEQVIQRQCVKSEMTKMLQEEQRSITSSAGVQQHRQAPLRLQVPSSESSSNAPTTPTASLQRVASATLLRQPTTPSGTLQRVASATLQPAPTTPGGTLQCGTSGAMIPQPTTPSGTLQRVGSAALLQRPPLSKLHADSGSCSRASSRQSSRPTSVGSSQPLSRASSFSSLGASRAGSQPGSRPLSRDASLNCLSRAGSQPGSRPLSRDASLNCLSQESSSLGGPPRSSSSHRPPSRCKDAGSAFLGRPPLHAGYTR